jgi:S1-C subfamily serine protease
MTRFVSKTAPSLVPLVFAAALLAPATAGAQDPLGEPARQQVRIAALQASRAHLGVMLGGSEEVGGRTGVAVERAIPGSPAERAGIRAGDILLSVNGEALGQDPGRGLTRLMEDVAPGDTVTIVLSRDGSDRTVQVVTDRSRAMVLRPGTDLGPMVAERFRDLRPALSFMAPGRHGLELVAMNPGLGRYFGTEEGVLVTNVPPESTIGLQPGDVILSIDGRAVRDPAHARGILASYRGDEGAEIRVMRDRRAVTVRATPGSRR